jgi:hypothetical protein
MNPGLAPLVTPDEAPLMTPGQARPARFWLQPLSLEAGLTSHTSRRPHARYWQGYGRVILEKIWNCI